MQNPNSKSKKSRIPIPKIQIHQAPRSKTPNLQIPIPKSKVPNLNRTFQNQKAPPKSRGRFGSRGLCGPPQAFKENMQGFRVEVTLGFTRCFAVADGELSVELIFCKIFASQSHEYKNHCYDVAPGNIAGFAKPNYCYSPSIRIYRSIFFIPTASCKCFFEISHLDIYSLIFKWEPYP